jgi:hypothetical protein
MWRAASIGPTKPRSHPASRLLSSTFAVSAVGLPALGCSNQTPTAPTRSPSARPGASVPAPSPAHQQMVTFTSSMAPFKLPAAVSRPTVFAAGDGLLMVGGLTAADTTTQAIWRLDLSLRTVNPAGQLPVPVHDAAGAVVDGRDLVFGGGSTAVTSAVQDVTPGASPRVVSHLPQPRADLVAISDSNAGYVLGSFDGVQGSTDILRTQDGRTFTVIGALPVAVRYPAVVASDGSIWLFGGEHDGRQVTDVQRIDLTTGHGSVAGHLPTPLAHAGALTLEGTILVAGGRIGATATNEVMRFDPVRVSFSAAGRLPAAQSDFGVPVVAGTAFLVGGESPKPVDTVMQGRAQPGGTP